jgi:hypothetical protein
VAFKRFRQEVRGNYKHALLNAIRAARHVGIRKRNIVSASVFTTQSVTAVFEKMRDQIKAATPDEVDAGLRNSASIRRRRPERLLANCRNRLEQFRVHASQGPRSQ